MLFGSFSTNNAFMVADVKRPTPAETSYILNLAIREYGQVSVSLDPALLTPTQITALDDGELGYPLSDYLGTGLTIGGNFSRYRKSPTSSVSLLFVVSSIA